MSVVQKRLFKHLLDEIDAHYGHLILLVRVHTEVGLVEKKIDSGRKNFTHNSLGQW
jgi:hypothetical protein